MAVWLRILKQTSEDWYNQDFFLVSLCDISRRHFFPHQDNQQKECAVADGFRFPVEAGKVREFARAVLDDDNPIYWDAEYARARGLPAPIVPPTFVQAAAFWRPTTPSAAERNLLRVLHGEQEFDYVRPLYVGDVLTVTTAKIQEFAKTGRRGGTMTFTVYETTYTNQHGQVCVKARSTTIETAQEVKD